MRNPEIWQDNWGAKGAEYVDKDSYAVKWHNRKPGWQPKRLWYGGNNNAYKALVASTLRELKK